MWIVPHCVAASIIFSSAKILMMNLVGCMLGCIIWLVFRNSHAALWIGCIVYGLGMSSSFPTAIHLAESYVQLSGKLASLLVVGACFGEMVIPILTSTLFGYTAPISLLFVLFGTTLLGTIVFGIILFVGKFTQKKRDIRGSFSRLGEELEEVRRSQAKDEHLES